MSVRHLDCLSVLCSLAEHALSPFPTPRRLKPADCFISHLLLLWEIKNNDRSGGAVRVIPELTGPRRLVPLTGQLTFWNPIREGISINHKEDKVDLAFLVATQLCVTSTRVKEARNCLHEWMHRDPRLQIYKMRVLTVVNLQWRVGAHWLSYSCLAVSTSHRLHLHTLYYHLWDKISLFTWEAFLSLLSPAPSESQTHSSDNMGRISTI